MRQNYDYAGAALAMVELLERLPVLAGDGPLGATHIRYMLERIIAMDDKEKAAQWLGYLNGIYVALSPNEYEALDVVKENSRSHDPDKA